MFSVIIPNHNGEATLLRTLEAVFRTGYRPLEVVVVDDASTDGSVRIIKEFPVKFLAHSSCRGAAAARDTGAGAATSDILVFVDNDVIIPPDTFRRLEEHFRDPNVSGVVGLLEPITPHRNLCSQYKNFYMHFTYMKLPKWVSVFYTSIAAIRREAFFDSGKFDPRYRSATIEDMEFGLRVVGKGYRLLMDKRLQVTHLKYYTLRTMLQTGFRRASGLTKIILRDRLRRKDKSSYTTTSFSFLGGIVLSSLTLLFLGVFLVLSHWCWLLPAAGCYLAMIGLNFGFLIGLARHTRPAYFFGGCGLIFIDLFIHGVGVLWGVFSFFRGRRY